MREHISSISNKWNDRYWWKLIFKRKVVGSVYNIITSPNGTKIADQDWDNLIILDACRYDLFEKIIDEYKEDLPGELEQIKSLGTGTPEFLKRNFARNEKYTDIVYLSSNPFVKKYANNKFHDIRHLWATHWNDSHKTVMPEDVCENYKSILQEYPNKRIILHFMQPHHPFVGDTLLKGDVGLEWAKAKSQNKSTPEVEFVWEKLRKRDVKQETVWNAYEDNLRVVLDEISNIADDLKGKTVITSDHGNAFGESLRWLPLSVYGHGSPFRIPELINVPWYTLDYESRRDIREDNEDKNQPATDDVDIEDRLKHLGYK
ncbi:MAG: hypothetical protein ABEI13_03880 [Candidatus Paceibacteria bacterium]